MVRARRFGVGDSTSGNDGIVEDESVFRICEHGGYISKGREGNGMNANLCLSGSVVGGTNTRRKRE